MKNKQKMKILIKFFLIFYICIFMLYSCIDANNSASLGPSYYFFVFPKETKEYKKFFEIYGPNMNGRKFNNNNNNEVAREYNVDAYISKVYFNDNGVNRNIYTEENWSISWLVYDSLNWDDYLIFRIDHDNLKESFHLSEKKINFQFYVNIRDLIDTINVFNARIEKDYGSYLGHDNISINGRKLYFLDLYKFSKTDFDKVREYYYNKFKIHYRLTTIDTKRSPVYYVLDENDTTNFNDY